MKRQLIGPLFVFAITFVALMALGLGTTSSAEAATSDQAALAQVLQTDAIQDIGPVAIDPEGGGSFDRQITTEAFGAQGTTAPLVAGTDFTWIGQTSRAKLDVTDTQHRDSVAARLTGETYGMAGALAPNMTTQSDTASFLGADYETKLTTTFAEAARFLSRVITIESDTHTEIGLSARMMDDIFVYPASSPAKLRAPTTEMDKVFAVTSNADTVNFESRSGTVITMASIFGQYGKMITGIGIVTIMVMFSIVYGYTTTRRRTRRIGHPTQHA